MPTRQLNPLAFCIGMNKNGNGNNDNTDIGSKNHNSSKKKVTRVQRASSTSFGASDPNRRRSLA